MGGCKYSNKTDIGLFILVGFAIDNPYGFQIELGTVILWSMLDRIGLAKTIGLFLRLTDSRTGHSIPSQLWNLMHTINLWSMQRP